MNPARIIRLAVCLVAGLALWAAPASARVYIDINQPFARKIPVAVPDFVPKDPAGAGPPEVTAELPRVLRDNLDLTGLFILLDPRTFLETNVRAGLTGDQINFAEWLAIGSELLIKGAFELKGEELTLELRLFDVFEGRMLLGRRYVGPPADGRQMVNRFLNELLQVLTGEPGLFGSLIAFVGRSRGHKEIFVVEFGGEEVVQVTRDESINLNPVFSRSGGELAYISYKAGSPQLYLRSLKGGERRISLGAGLYLTPCFTPDGGLLAAISSKKSTNIFRLNTQGQIQEQLTRSWGINISPTLSPDGSLFAFVSDRAGGPQVYIAPTAGGPARRVTLQGKYNTDPRWSPRGDRLAFVGQTEDGRFNIFTINPDGSDLQQLTAGSGDNTSPSWSPDGRLLAFASTRRGQSLIYTMTANGERQRPLTPDFKSAQEDPNWSPVRPPLGRVSK